MSIAGDRVLCIVDGNETSLGILPHWLCGAEIVKGSVYTVEKVVRGVDNFAEEVTGYVLLERDTRWPQKNGSIGAWSTRHFAPINKDVKEIQIYAQMKEPA